MRPPAKAALIAAAYVAALAIAYGAVAINEASMDPITRQGGMAAFGSSVLFLGVFAFCAVPITGYALYSVRDRTALWRVLSIGAMGIAGTALASLIVFSAAGNATKGSTLEMWAGIGVLRMFVAPVFALAFTVASIFAPNRFARITLFGSAIVETMTFVFVFTGMTP